MAVVDPFAQDDDEAQASTDPWAPDPEPVKKAPAKKAAAKPVEVQGPSDKIVVTLKGGAGFDAPWIVIHASNVAEAISTVRETADLMEITQKAAAHFAGQKASGGSAPARRGAAPAAAQQAPNGDSRQCEHGEMRFKSGVSKAGKPYKAFFCTADKSEECTPIFLR